MHWQGLSCPDCGYDLRGSPQPICPECGGRFKLQEKERMSFRPFVGWSSCIFSSVIAPGSMFCIFKLVPLYFEEYGGGCGTVRLLVTGAMLMEVPALVLLSFGMWMLALKFRCGDRIAGRTMIASLMLLIAGWALICNASALVRW